MSMAFDRLERRVQRLEDAMDAHKFTGLELAKAVRELLEMRQTFYDQLESRPIIKEALRNYQTLIKAADEQEESSSHWASAIRSELLMQELPRIRAFAGMFETFNQLESIVDQPLVADFNGLANELQKIQTSSGDINGEVMDMEASVRIFATAQASAIALVEEKILEIDEKLPAS